MSIKTNVLDEQIKKAFDDSNFGSRDHRKLLEQGVLKSQAGYKSGGTLTLIMKHLKLIDANKYITRKGKMFLFSAFYNQLPDVKKQENDDSLKNQALDECLNFYLVNKLMNSSRKMSVSEDKIFKIGERIHNENLNSMKKK